MSWMGRKRAEFEPLWPAEQKLVDEMAAGQTVAIGPDVPPQDAGRELRLRASFLRYLETAPAAPDSAMIRSDVEELGT